MKQTEAEKDGTIIRIDVLKKQYPKLYGELIEALAELYPQQQVKTDLIAGVVGRSEQLICPKCKGNEVLVGDGDNECAYTDCQHTWAK